MSQHESLRERKEQHKPKNTKSKIDDKDINTFDSKELAKIVSAVRKSPTFFNISIRDNLSIFDPNFENIVYFCKLFNIHDYIMGLENGYDTVLLTDASSFSLKVSVLSTASPKVLFMFFG